MCIQGNTVPSYVTMNHVSIISMHERRGEVVSRGFWSGARVAQLLFSLNEYLCELFCVKINMGSYLTASISPISVVLLRFDTKDGYPSYP